MKSPKREGDLLVEWAALCLIVSSEEVAAHCACRHCALLALKIEVLYENHRNPDRQDRLTLVHSYAIPSYLLLRQCWSRCHGQLVMVERSSRRWRGGNGCMVVVGAGGGVNRSFRVSF